MSSALDPDTLTAADLALIQDPEFYRRGPPLMHRLAVAVLEARQNPIDPTVQANEQVLAAHERIRSLDYDNEQLKRNARNDAERIRLLEESVVDLTRQLKNARESAFAHIEAREVRRLLRQAIKALTP